MSDTDFELLSRYTRNHSEDAFAEIVRRHLGLVYSAALRQLRCSQLAGEVAQSTFIKLAREARRLAPDTIVSAWLYQVTRHEAIDVTRRDARRKLREQVSTELTAMHATDSDWTHIEPLLDEAMHALAKTDRAAVLLRYFENKSLREVGAALGISENAAQKRLGRALERLREFFAKRGVTIGESGLVVVISTNAILMAPAGLSAAITGSVLAATTMVTTTTGAAIAVATLQKTLIAAVLMTAAAIAIYEAREASIFRSQVTALKQRQSALSEQMDRDRDDAAGQLSALRRENAILKRDSAEFLKLRGDLIRLRQQLATNKRDTPGQAPVSEYAYQGKTLSDWVRDLSSTDQSVRQTAHDAFTAMGADASPAIPSLAALLQSSRVPNAAAWALAHIGPNALPTLINALTNGNTAARLEATGVIGVLRDAAEEAVPAIVENLRHEDRFVRANAVAALQSIPKHPEVAVPALVACLTDDEVMVRDNAATVLRSFGKAAESAIPELVRAAREDNDSHVRTSAVESLRTISPERADAEGL